MASRALMMRIVFSLYVCMNDDQNVSFGRFSDCDKPRFFIRMKRVANRHRKCIAENRGFFLKRNAMLFQITIGFVGIPFKSESHYVKSFSHLNRYGWLYRYDELFSDVGFLLGSFFAVSERI